MSPLKIIPKPTLTPFKRNHQSGAMLTTEEKLDRKKRLCDLAKILRREEEKRDSSIKSTASFQPAFNRTKGIAHETFLEESLNHEYSNLLKTQQGQSSSRENTPGLRKSKRRFRNQFSSLKEVRQLTVPGADEDLSCYIQMFDDDKSVRTGGALAINKIR